MVLTLLSTILFMIPAVVILVFASSYEGVGQDIVKFGAMMVTSGWLLWVAFLFFFPTTLNLCKRAASIMRQDKHLTLVEAFSLVGHSILNAIPFYYSGKARQ
jgi:hypothetical protein